MFRADGAPGLSETAWKLAFLVVGHLSGCGGSAPLVSDGVENGVERCVGNKPAKHTLGLRSVAELEIPVFGGLAISMGWSQSQGKSCELRYDKEFS